MAPMTYRMTESHKEYWEHNGQQIVREGSRYAAKGFLTYPSGCRPYGDHGGTYMQVGAEWARGVILSWQTAAVGEAQGGGDRGPGQ